MKNITQYNIRRMIVSLLSLTTIINWIIWYALDSETAGFIALICFMTIFFGLTFILKDECGQEDYFNPNEEIDKEKRKNWTTSDEVKYLFKYLLKGIFCGPIIIFSNYRWCKTKGKRIELLFFGIFLVVAYISVPIVSGHYYFIRKPVIEEAKEEKRKIKEEKMQIEKEQRKIAKEEKRIECETKGLHLYRNDNVYYCGTNTLYYEECQAKGLRLYRSENGYYYCDITWYEALYKTLINIIAKIKTDVEEAQYKK